MGYSISEGVDDGARDLKAMRAIAKRYPDAHTTELPYPDEKRRHTVWASEDVEPTDARLVGEYLCRFVIVEGKAVFHPTWVYAGDLMERLKKKAPEVYAMLVRGGP